MTLTLEDLFGILYPEQSISSQDGTINVSAAEDWVRSNIDAVKNLFADRAMGLHLGRAQSGLAGYSSGVGLGIEGGLEATFGFGGSTGDGFFGQPSLDFGFTAAGALLAGFDFKAGAFDLGLSNETVFEPALVFGRIDDLKGAAAGVEFTITINGITGGFGAVVPADSLSDVVSKIDQHLTGSAFSTTGGGTTAIADALSDIFPPGSMLMALGGQTNEGTFGGALTFEGIVTGVGSTESAATQDLRAVVFEQFTECFLSGTEISEWAGPTKPIEAVEVGDQVTSYDQHGNLVPGTVTRVFQNRVKHILDVFGLHVTPGHVTLCGDGPFAGRHVPMIDILRSDGASVRESGEKIRACTNEPVGSAKDQFIWAVTGEKQADGALKIRDRGRIRLGTRFITAEGYDVSVADLIAAAHATVTPEGLIQQSSGGAGVPFFWSFTARLPRPEDYVLQRSELQLNDIYQAAEWESVPPHLPRPSVAMA